MGADKRAWQQPELTVLVRNRSEEAVLAACKDVGGVQGPAAGNCSKPSPGCSIIAPS